MNPRPRDSMRLARRGVRGLPGGAGRERLASRHVGAASAPRARRAGGLGPVQHGQVRVGNQRQQEVLSGIIEKGPIFSAEEYVATIKLLYR